jgi:hypothetical protein
MHPPASAKGALTTRGSQGYSGNCYGAAAAIHSSAAATFNVFE